ARQPGQGFIAAAYRHRMSRALDPQLHTHVVAANLTKGPDDRFTALFGAPLYQAAKTAGYLYQAHLRAEVRDRLGLRWGPVRKGAAELAGVPTDVLDEFSRRRHEMERAAAEGGFSLSTKRSAEAAAVDTRERKQYGIDTHTWREEIEARAAEHGLDREAVQDLIAREGAGQRIDGGDDVDPEILGRRLAADDGLTERANTFDRRPVLQAYAEAAAQGARVGAIGFRADQFCGRGDVLQLRGRQFTTAGLVDCERRLVVAAVGRAGEGCAAIPAGASDSLLADLERTPSAAQTDVVRGVATDGHGVSVVEALAGTGKTYAAGALREIYEASGHVVLGVAPTARAARELTEQAGIPARTIDRMLIDIEQFALPIPPGSVIVLDEAGMAPTRLTTRLLEHAADAGAKVIAFGDSRQLPSVFAGGWLRAVGERIGSLRLTEVLRQRSPDERRALAALHEGIPRKYLRWAEGNDRIELCGADTRDGRAIERWAAAVEAHGPAQGVMIARDNDTRHGLNALAR
ncbi:MAG: MobF family relaxase, partial [Solirubrobacteraceae bacterium]